MKTLYRAYRPQNFAEIVNQNHVKITLEHEISSGKMAHAYIFCGPRGIGKTTIARIFAKSLNCENRKKGEYEPCNKCDLCQDVTKGRSLDVIEIDAASYTGVDNVRENIISVARVAPTRGKFKVFIIDEVHMLSISAFNALLKLLEEPPSHAIFILCTTEVHKIPDTIISRTERFDFKRISAGDIVKKLQYICTKEKIKIDTTILENIARQSGGHMRDAESLLGQVVSIGGSEVSPEEADLVLPRSDINEVINFIELLTKKDAGSAIGLINQLLDGGVDLKRFIAETIELLRKMMLSKIDQGLSEKFGLELGESMELRTTEVNAKIEEDYIIKIIERLLIVQKEMKDVFIEQLPLEIAVAELCMPILDKSQNNNFDFQKKQNQVNSIKVSSLPQGVSSKNHNTVVSANSKKDKDNFKNNIVLNKDQIISKWSLVLAKIKKYNHSLAIILGACQVQDLNNNELCLAFKYKFHKERIKEKEIKEIVEKVLEEVYEQAITIETVVDEKISVQEHQVDNDISKGEENVSKESSNDKIETETRGDSTNKNTDEDMLKNVLETFGGKVM